MTKTKKTSLLLTAIFAVLAFAMASFIAIKQVEADAVPVIAIEETAEISFDDIKSLRFTGHVSESVNLSAPKPLGDYSATDTYAGIIIAKGALEAGQLTIDTANVMKFPAKDYMSGSGTKAFSAVIENIEVADYTQIYTARSYVCSNGEYTYSATVSQRSFVQVASKVFAEDAKNLLVEDWKALREIVEVANPVVKIDGVTLDDSIENIIEIAPAGEKSVTIEPASLNLTAMINAERNNLSITCADNKIKIGPTFLGEDRVYIDIGNKVYIVKVKVVGTYTNPDLAGTNVLLNFDNERDISGLQNGSKPASEGGTYNKSITYVDKDSEEGKSIGATSGVARVETGGGWKVTKYNLPQAVKLTQIAGFYIKYKMPAEFEADANDGANGSMWIVVKGADKTGVEKKISTINLRAYKAGNGDWNCLTISNLDMQKTFGLTAEDKLESVSIMNVSAACVYYIDEIGIYEEEDSSMIVSFDTEEQKGLLWNRFIAQPWKIVLPGETGYPTRLKDADSGLLVITPKATHGGQQHLGVSNTVPTAGLTKIKIRIYVPENATFTNYGYNTGFRIMFNESVSSANVSEALVRFDNLRRGQWNEVDASIEGTFTSDYIYSMFMFKDMYGSDGTASIWQAEETRWYVDYIQAIYA